MFEPMSSHVEIKMAAKTNSIYFMSTLYFIILVRFVASSCIQSFWCVVVSLPIIARILLKLDWDHHDKKDIECVRLVLAAISSLSFLWCKSDI